MAAGKRNPFHDVVSARNTPLMGVGAAAPAPGCWCPSARAGDGDSSGPRRTGSGGHASRRPEGEFQKLLDHQIDGREDDGVRSLRAV